LSYVCSGVAMGAKCSCVELPVQWRSNGGEVQLR